MNNREKICVVISTIPPAFAGGGLRAYRHAVRLHKKNKLAFILTEKPKVDGVKKTGLNNEVKLPADKIVAVLSRPHKNTIHSKKTINYLSFVLWQICFLISISWSLFNQKDSYKTIHCFGASNWLSLYAVAIGNLLGKKTMLEMTLLGSDDPVTIKSDRIKLIGRFRCWLFSKADIIVSISPALSSAYKMSGLPVDKLREVSNPVNTEKFYPPSIEEKVKSRDKLTIESNRLVILFVGAILKRKGVDLLIDFVAKLAVKYPEVLLFCVGPTDNVDEERELTSKMKRRARKLNVADRVIFTDMVDNVNEYMRASDVFIFLSRQEGFPNVVIEAMSTGIPVVVLNIPGITKHIIRDGIDGVIVEEEDTDRIASAVEKLLGDRELYERISINARKTATNRFSVEVIDQKYWRIYEMLHQ